MQAGKEALYVTAVVHRGEAIIRHLEGHVYILLMTCLGLQFSF